jgi:phosphoglycerate dehydrogenase-like enzyme
VVDEKALIAALQAGTIAGAGLDVFENEPNIPAELAALENVVLTPHMASGTLVTGRPWRNWRSPICRRISGKPVVTPVPD